MSTCDVLSGGSKLENWYNQTAGRSIAWKPVILGFDSRFEKSAQRHTTNSATGTPTLNGELPYKIRGY